MIGRGIEFSPWQVIVADARERGCRTLQAEWLRTAKNSQVEDFYDRLGLPLTHESADRRAYESPLDDLSLDPEPHISLTHDR